MGGSGAMTCQWSLLGLGYCGAIEHRSSRVRDTVRIHGHGIDMVLHSELDARLADAAAGSHARQEQGFGRV